MAWFRRTGQAWKLVVFGLVCALGWLGDSGEVSWDLLRILLGLAGLSWFFWSVRCPHCQGRPVWFMASRMDAAGFNPFGLDRCPICRDTGDVRPPAPPLFSAYRRPM